MSGTVLRLFNMSFMVCTGADLKGTDMEVEQLSEMVFDSWHWCVPFISTSYRMVKEKFGGQSSNEASSLVSIS